MSEDFELVTQRAVKSLALKLRVIFDTFQLIFSRNLEEHTQSTKLNIRRDGFCSI